MARGFDCFLVHEKVGSDAKLRRMPVECRWAFIAGVLAIAAQSPRRGYLLVADGMEATAADVAHEANVPADVAQVTLDDGRNLGLIVDTSDGMKVAKWDVWQPAPRRSETREEWRKRKRRQRERDVKKPAVPEPAEQPRSDVDRLCQLLADLIRRNDPKARVLPESDRWRKAARLLLDKDKRTVDEVERVIRWCQDDEFWQANVLSMTALRDKFEQLALKAKARPVRAVKARTEPTDPLDEDTRRFYERHGIAVPADATYNDLPALDAQFTEQEAAQ